jgi:ABC-2 type transport system permease protein
MNAFLAMTIANARMILRNRSALFFLLIFPIIFIVIFGFLVGEGDFQLRVGIAGEDVSPVTAAIADQMEATEGFTVYRGSVESELDEIADGNRTIVLVFSEGEGEHPAQAEIYFDQANPSQAQIGISAVEQFLLQAEAEITGQPRLIDTSIAGVEGDSFRYIDFLVPGIIGMSLMVNGIVSLSSTFVTFRERGILRRIKATPFPLWEFILSRITTQVVIAVAQAVILLGVGVILFDIYVSSSYASLLVMVMLGALAVLSIWFVVSAFAANSDVANSAANAIFVPMMFLGGVFFPLENAPGWMRPITDAMPLTYLVNALRDIIIDGATLVDVWPEILVMLATALIGMLIAVRFFRWESRTV